MFTLKKSILWFQNYPLSAEQIIRHALSSSNAVPAPGAGLAPGARSPPCAFSGLDTVPPNAQDTETVACTTHRSAANETARCAMVEYVSLLPPSLPPASAFRCQPVSTPGKADIVAILRKRELDSRK